MKQFAEMQRLNGAENVAMRNVSACPCAAQQDLGHFPITVAELSSPLSQHISFCLICVAKHAMTLHTVTGVEAVFRQVSTCATFAAGDIQHRIK